MKKIFTKENLIIIVLAPLLVTIVGGIIVVLFENAASTRKRNTNDSLTLEEYLIENTGKFFGYRRAQVFRRYVNENLWGHLSEVNSVELVNRFSKK